MKATGIIRNIDPVGRLVIPAELCKSFGIVCKTEKAKGTGIDISIKDNYIVLKKADIEPVGIVRHVDGLRRITIPKEVERIMELSRDNLDCLEIFVEEESILLRKYTPGCIFCGSVDNTQYMLGKHICISCLRSIKASK